MPDTVLSTTLQQAARLIGERLPAAYDLVPGDVVLAPDLAAHAMPADAVAVRFPLADGAAVLVVAVPEESAAMLRSGPPQRSLPDALADRVVDGAPALAEVLGDVALMIGDGVEVPADQALDEGPGDMVSVALDDAGIHRATIALRMVVTDAMLEPIAAPAPVVEQAPAPAPQPVAAHPAAGQPAQMAAAAAPVAPGASGEAHPADFPSFEQLTSFPGQGHSMAMLGEVEMGVTAVLGRTKLSVREILGLNEGSIIELDRAAGSPVDVVVNGTLIARGEVVVIDEEFGVRITEIVGVEDDASYPVPVAQ